MGAASARGPDPGDVRAAPASAQTTSANYPPAPGSYPAPPQGYDGSWQAAAKQGQGAFNQYLATSVAQATGQPPAGSAPAGAQDLSAQWHQAAAQNQLGPWLAAKVAEAQAAGTPAPGTWQAAAVNGGTDSLIAWLKGASATVGTDAISSAATQEAAAQKQVANINQYDASFQKVEADKTYQAGHSLEKVGASQVPYGIGTLFVMATDAIAEAVVHGPHISGIVDPLGEAYSRLPIDLRSRMEAAAQNLPPWPNEDKVQPPQVRILLRMTQAAKKAGLWPSDPNDIQGQLTAWAKVTLGG